MTESLTIVNEWLDFFFTYGTIWVYLVIMLACFVENLFPPFPGDTFIVVAGGLVALGRLDWYVALLIINIGGLVSVMLLYYFGQNYGRAYFIRRDFKYFSAEDIQKAEVRMNKWGWLVLVGSRFIVGFRSAIAVVAGISRYHSTKMFLFSAVSYFAFTSLLMYIGFSLVENLGEISELVDKYNMIVWPILVLLTMIWIWRRYKNTKRTV